MMFKTLLSAVSPGGAHGRLSVLIFHRVLAQPDPIFPDELDARHFDQMCGWLAELCHVLPVDEAMQRLRDGSLPRRAAVITFDDGYADNHDVALPILQRHRLPAVVYVASGYLNGGCMWNDTLIETVRRVPGDRLDVRAVLPDLAVLPLRTPQERRQAITTLIGRTKYLLPDERLQTVNAVARLAGVPMPNDLMMTSAQLRGLHRGGVLIGGHSVNHPIMAKLDRAGALREAADCRQSLEAELNAPVRHFAYPNGKPGEDFTAETMAAVREAGYESAMSTTAGAAHRGSDPFAVPRVAPWARDGRRFALRLAQGLWQSRPRGAQAR